MLTPDGEAVNTQTRFWKLPVPIAARRDLGSAAKLVYMAIADRVGENSHAWPGVRRVADDTGLSINAVLRGIRELERAGLIELNRHAGPRGANTYCIRNGSASDSAALPKRKRTVSISAARRAAETKTEPDPLTRPMNQRRRGRETQPRLPLTGADLDDTGEGELARQVIAAWTETYHEARGVKCDPIDGRQAGAARQLVKLAGGDVEKIRRRFRLALGLNGRAPPWPFADKRGRPIPGEATLPNIVSQWARLSDAERTDDHVDPCRVPVPPGKYDGLPVIR